MNIPDPEYLEQHKPGYSRDPVTEALIRELVERIEKLEALHSYELKGEL